MQPDPAAPSDPFASPEGVPGEPERAADSPRPRAPAGSAGSMGADGTEGGPVADRGASKGTTDGPPVPASCPDPAEAAESVDLGGPAASATLSTSGTSSKEDTADLYLPSELHALLAEYEGTAGGFPGTPPGAEPSDGPSDPAQLHEPDLLDCVGLWPAVPTPVGTLRLVPVELPRDLRLLAAWMNDPSVAAFWELDGPEERTAAHMRAQLEGDGRSVPCLGVLDGRPVSYWELYRADLDPVARYCRARPHDTGLHLLVGQVGDRGRGVGTALLRAVAELVLDQRPSCGRVLAEPDLRNIPSVAAFLGAGFRFSAEVDMPGKRAALMVRDRELRSVL